MSKTAPSAGLALLALVGLACTARAADPRPPLGKYNCYTTAGVYMYAGSFVLRDGSVYEWTGQKPSRGRYRTQGKAVSFLDGPLKSAHGEFVSDADGPRILLELQHGGESIQERCGLQTDAR